jgi:hypothetical protein
MVLLEDIEQAVMNQWIRLSAVGIEGQVFGYVELAEQTPVEIWISAPLILEANSDDNEQQKRGACGQESD